MLLERIRIYPIKSLAGFELAESGFTEAGALINDRRWCLVDQQASHVTPDSVFMTKSEATSSPCRLLRTRVHYGTSPVAMSLELDGKRSSEFRLPGDAEALSMWCSEQYGGSFRLTESPDLGWPDTAVFSDAEMAQSLSGPSVISTSTLHFLAEHLGIASDELFLRFRTNLLVHSEELPPFGEEELPELQLGDVRLAVMRRVQRCPAPARDLASGVFDREFTKQLVEAKLETAIGKSLPRDEHYTVSVYTKVLTPDARLSVDG